MVDGDAFECLARDLGLFYSDTHNVSRWIGGIEGNVLTHNSDGCIVPPGTPVREYDYIWSIPNNVTHWFAQNVDVVNRRLIPIPIGLERDRWHPELHKKDVLLSLHKVQNKNLVYLNVNTEIRVQREELYQRFSDKSWCTSERGRNGVLFPHYAKQLAAHKFTFCPDGNGYDTHRTWEALYAGSYPIVQRHVFTTEFAKILPLVVVDSWDEITEDYLDTKYERFAVRAWQWEALTMDYWRNLITNVIR